MHLSAPGSLDDIITDGAFIAAGVDHALAQRYGVIRSVNVHVADVPVDARPDVVVDAELVTNDGDHPARAQRIAVIRDGQWTWTTGLIDGLDVPELRDPVAPRERLQAAARTLTGGKPVLIVPVADGAEAVVSIAADHGPLSPRHAIAGGVRQLAGRLDEERAVIAYATANGVDSARVDGGLLLGDAVKVTLTPGAHRGAMRITDVSGGLAREDVLADAFYTAVEHRLLFDGKYPGASVAVDLKAGRARVTSGGRSFEAAAHMIATVTGGTWTWAWADGHLAGTDIAQASVGLARFGEDNGIIDLVRPTMPASWARESALSMIAMPILGVWTLATVALNDSTTGLVLLGGREFDLPAPTPEAVEAVLSAPLPAGVSLERALAAYARGRGLRADESRLYFPDGTAVRTNPVAIERP